MHMKKYIPSPTSRSHPPPPNTPPRSVSSALPWPRPHAHLWVPDPHTSCVTMRQRPAVGQSAVLAADRPERPSDRRRDLTASQHAGPAQSLTGAGDRSAARRLVDDSSHNACAAGRHAHSARRHALSAGRHAHSARRYALSAGRHAPSAGRHDLSRSGGTRPAGPAGGARFSPHMQALRGVCPRWQSWVWSLSAPAERGVDPLRQSAQQAHAGTAASRPTPAERRPLERGV